MGNLLLTFYTLQENRFICEWWEDNNGLMLIEDLGLLKFPKAGKKCIEFQKQPSNNKYYV